MLLQTKQGERLLLLAAACCRTYLLPRSGLAELQRGLLSFLEILALCFSILFVGLKPRGCLEEAIDFDSCNSWLNRSTSSKLRGLCKGRQAVFEETTEGIKKREKLSPAFSFNFSEATKCGTSETEADTEVFQFVFC